ncbi:hypothetical protein H6G89_10210 [Oscillatoria sp. FACHB-1407]|uniref:DUF6985 domain-containing protein n=1 Tax=Oscillatoria sp. FACHB-1407 TaxID=2692847 RepID=UPI0016882ED9|nr:hypothetical protein [Oscillatoria sp. FACHB-1407]MBD2461421.1 hypothetical protein [Oscillatoria sp. FACHB-1407]
MDNIEAPIFPEYVDDEYHHVSTITLPAFAGMQTTNAPYGAVSSPEPSIGETHAISNKSLDPKIFRAAVSWVIENAAEIRKLLFPALVEQYWEMRDLVIECLMDENPDDVVPEIEEPEELAKLCRLVAVHIGGQTTDGLPRFGIELGCNWEEEHGAGVRFVGLRVVKAGDASDAFTFPKYEA